MRNVSDLQLSCLSPQAKRKFHDMCTLPDRDAAIEKWLVEEVVPTLDALDADPSRAIPADEAWRRIQAHMNARVSKKREG